MILIHRLVVRHEKGILTELEESTTGTSTKGSYGRKILSKSKRIGEMRAIILARYQTEKDTSSRVSTLSVHSKPQKGSHERAYKTLTSESVISSDEDATLR